MSGFQLPPGFTPSAGPSGGNGGGGGGGGQKGQSAEEQAAARERAAAQEEMKRSMISTMLEPAARERRESRDETMQPVIEAQLTTVSRISLTRPELGRGVEELLVRMGQQGQIRGKVTDEALKGLLEQVSGPLQAKASTPSVAPSARTKTLGGGIIIQRKGDDSDSDEYDL